MRSLEPASEATGDVTCGHKVLWANHAKEQRFAAKGFARPRIHKSAGRSTCQSPLCPDSDQIPQRSEMTRGPKGDKVQRKNAASFDHLVGEREQVWRLGEAKRRRF